MVSFLITILSLITFAMLIIAMVCDVMEAFHPETKALTRIKPLLLLTTIVILLIFAGLLGLLDKNAIWIRILRDILDINFWKNTMFVGCTY